MKYDLATPPLLWMEHEAMSAGLQLRSRTESWDTKNLKSDVYNSMLKLWPYIEYLPIKHLTYESADSTAWRALFLLQRALQLLILVSRPHRQWHLQKGRVIVEGQKIHVSLAFKDKPYEPAAQAQDPSLELDLGSLVGQASSDSEGWELVTKWNQNHKVKLEMDAFDLSQVKTLLENLSKDFETRNNNVVAHLNRLRFIATSGKPKVHVIRDECLPLTNCSALGALEIKKLEGIKSISSMLWNDAASDVQERIQRQGADCLAMMLSTLRTSFHDLVA